MKAPSQSDTELTTAYYSEQFFTFQSILFLYGHTYALDNNMITNHVQLVTLGKTIKTKTTDEMLLQHQQQTWPQLSLIRNG